MAWSPPADPAGDAEATSALASLAGAIRAAQATATPLRIRGGDTKRRLLEALPGAQLDMRTYRGVLAYEPSELVIEVRAGTLLADVETLLAEHGQMLASEPPRCGPASTIGGVVSAGLSGPARPWAGALRDHVLGIGLLSPAGELLRFGGRVMKNVAGYDVSRLACAAWGTLGPIATLALRVAPLAERTVSLQWQMQAPAAHAHLQTLARTSWPLAGAAHDGGCLRLRLAGSAAAVDDAVTRLAPDALDADDLWWQALRDLAPPALGHTVDADGLWRVSLPPAANIVAPGHEVIDWGGAQRWWWAPGIAAAEIHARVRAAVGAQGHAVPMFAAPAHDFPLPSAAQGALQARLRRAFDPQELFNRGCSRTGH